jgi:pyruvate kinase
VVQPGDRVFLNEGCIQLRVSGIEGDEVFCRVVAGGELHSSNGVNLPGIDLGTAAFTERDRDCLEFALHKGVDAVSQSFVERADDIRDLRQAADGIMIARGDLGVEVPIEQIAVVQKQLIRRANRQAKPVITATQMLESMTENPRPTRAEAKDVANAILDGTDCVMLSAKSAVGDYPAEAVATLAEIAAATEPRRPRPADRESGPAEDRTKSLHPAELIALAVEAVLRYAAPAAVFVPAGNGATVRRIGRSRPPASLIALSPEEKGCQDLQFSRGVEPVKLAQLPEDWNPCIGDYCREQHLRDKTVLLVSGPSPDHPDAAHSLQILAPDQRP